MADASIDRIVFDSGLVRVGAFRCAPRHPCFHDSGPPENFCFVFPRTAVAIQHEHERAFVANPNVVTFYNRGQPYRRDTISDRGDRCDWFGVAGDVALDVVRSLDQSADRRPEQPFRMTRAFSDPQTYLLQRRLFDQIVAGTEEPLAVEERVVFLLERVLRTAYSGVSACGADGGPPRPLDIVHDAETILSARWDEHLQLGDLAEILDVSVYHLCRTFRRATGTTLHQYRHDLRVRHALEAVQESDEPLVRIALDMGFSSHSHFTSAFRHQFGATPSVLRGERALAS